jgi:hypothetical protein
MVILAAVGSFRFAFGHFDIANASGFVRPNSDRRAHNKAFEVILADVGPPSPASVSPPTDHNIPNSGHTTTDPMPRLVNEMPHIVSRHWHEHVLPVARQAKDSGRKRIHARSVDGNKSQTNAAPKNCQLMEFDGIRRALNLPTGCHS